MAKRSAGLLMVRPTARGPELLLAHPGGPFFRHKDDGHWTLPKGELAEGEAPLACALREFREETGLDPGEGPFLDLGEVQQKGGKRVHGFAFASDLTPIDPPPCNEVELEWPPRSGKRLRFPEIDRVALFPVAAARQKLMPAQLPLVERLLALLERA